MNILEELWYGNVHPCEQPLKEGSDYAKAVRKVTKEKEQLLSCLSQEQQAALEKLLDVQIDATAFAERDAFIMGFRMASQLMADIFHS